MKEANKIKVSLKTAILIIIILLIAVIMLGITIKIRMEGNNKLKQNSEYIIISNDQFPMLFLKMENNKKNMIYSPLSIKYALKMLEEGAAGNTKIQIENVIGNLNLTKYNNINDKLSLANAIYIRDSYLEYVKKDYIKTLGNKYNAEVNYDNFNNANNINNWIKNKTLGQISNIINDKLVQNKNTEMLLINALAIDMEWEDSFDKTYGKTFFLLDGNTINAATMNQKTSSDNISYYKDKDITALTMDLKEYENNKLQFIAIMPDSNLENYVEKLTKEEINNIIDKSTLASKTKYGLDISIPKFSFDYDLNLKEDLINLGITDAFDNYLADFSNMSNSELYVGEALHKANIDFTEKGVKAAATTVMVMVDKMAVVDKTDPVEIKIDKPFLYLIKDKISDEIWFVGTVYEPNSWEEDKADYQR